MPLRGENLDSVITDYEVTESGTYTVVVSYANSGSEGSVEITVTLQ